MSWKGAEHTCDVSAAGRLSLQGAIQQLEMAGWESHHSTGVIVLLSCQLYNKFSGTVPSRVNLHGTVPRKFTAACCPFVKNMLEGLHWRLSSRGTIQST